MKFATAFLDQQGVHIKTKKNIVCEPRDWIVIFFLWAYKNLLITSKLIYQIAKKSLSWLTLFVLHQAQRMYNAQTSKCRDIVLGSKPFDEALTVKLHIGVEPHSDCVTSYAPTSRKELKFHSSKSEQRKRKEITGC